MCGCIVHELLACIHDSFGAVRLVCRDCTEGVQCLGHEPVFRFEDVGDDAANEWFVVDDDRMQLEPGETPEMRRVRFRSLGCYPLSAAIEVAE